MLVKSTMTFNVIELNIVRRLTIDFQFNLISVENLRFPIHFTISSIVYDDINNFD